MEWYYALEGRQAGPVDENELKNLAITGVVQPDTLVWRNGFDNWQPAKHAAPAVFSGIGAGSANTSFSTPAVLPEAPLPATAAPHRAPREIMLWQKVVAGVFSVVLIIGLVGMLAPSGMRGGLSFLQYKMIASTGFVLVALAAGAHTFRYHHWVFAAMVLCWLGDYYLGVGQFISGLVAFLLGHVALIVAFLQFEINKSWCVYGLIAAVVIGLTAVFLLMPHIPASERIPVIMYTLVIAGMVGVAAGAWAVEASSLVLAGAVLFYFSDLCVAIQRYLDTAFRVSYVGLPMYYAGVLLLALSVFTYHERLED